MKLKLFLVGMSLLSYSVYGLCLSPKAQAIRDAKTLYQSYPYTFFCHKPIQPDGSLYERKCDTCPLIRTKVSWMSIVPIKRLAKDRSCYAQKQCLNSSGKRFKGISCCRKIDAQFIQMESDLHNLVPEEPLLSQLNAKSTIGPVPLELGSFVCDLRYASKEKRLQPPAQSQGMLARTYLYYESQYQLALTKEERDLYIQWHYQSPPTDWEKQRQSKIFALTKKRNQWVY